MGDLEAPNGTGTGAGARRGRPPRPGPGPGPPGRRPRAVAPSTGAEGRPAADRPCNAPESAGDAALRRVAGPGQAVARGRAAVTVVPFGPLSMEIRPPWAVIREWTMARPRPAMRPEPSVRVVTNGSKTCASTSGAMPGPSSETVSTISPASRRADTSAAVPGGLCVIA